MPPRATAVSINRLDWQIAITLALATLVTYSQSWAFDFTNWDDGAYITNNSNLHDVAGLVRVWFSSQNEQYYPLTFTTFWLEHQLWGDSPTGYHVVNTVLHALNAMVVLILGRRMGLSTLMATAVATFFAIHPMQGMTVAWVAERKTLLACLCILLATLAWMDYRDRGSPASYMMSLVLFALALLSKTAILLAPLSWMLLDATKFNRSFRQSLAALFPTFGLAIAATLVTRHFESGFLDAQAWTMIPTPLHRVLLSGTTLWWYGLTLLFPIQLSPIYPLWRIEPSKIAWWIGLCALVFSIIAGLRWRSRLRANEKWGLAWFLLMLAPTSGLLAYGNLGVTPVSNHYVYISCIGFFVAIGEFLERWTAGRGARTRGVTAVLCCVAIGSIVAARTQIRVFANSKSLWTSALTRDPDCFAAHLGLGQDALADKNLPLALEHFSAATRIRPGQYEGYAGVGDVLIRMQNWRDARPSIDRALSINPNHVSTMLGRATLAEHEGDWPTALELARRANQTDPGDARGAVQLGILLIRIVSNERNRDPAAVISADPRLAEARATFERVITLRPHDEAGYRGAVECDRLRRDWSSAISTARAGLSAVPNSVPLKNLLAITLARCPDEHLRDGPAAVRLAQEIAPALGGNNVQLMETLASAYGAAGRFKEAAAVSREAARIARSSGQAQAAQANERWAADYDMNKPRLD